MEQTPKFIHMQRFPAFRNWDVSDDVPITQYFESARQAGLHARKNHEPLPLWDFHSPLPPTFYRVTNKIGLDWGHTFRGNETGRRVRGGRETKKPARVCDAALETLSPPAQPKRNPKAVDEDLYKIPPELLRKNRRLQHKLFNFFSSMFRRQWVCY